MMLRPKRDQKIFCDSAELGENNNIEKRRQQNYWVIA